MADKMTEFEAKLVEAGFSIASAENVHGEISEVFRNEETGFDGIKDLLGVADRDCTTLRYDSVLWPGFYFEVRGNRDGSLESARFYRSCRQHA